MKFKNWSLKSKLSLYFLIIILSFAIIYTINVTLTVIVWAIGVYQFNIYIINDEELLLIVFWVIPIIVLILTCIIFGWILSRSLIYLLSWLRNLSDGIYERPSSSSFKLKGYHYQIFDDVFVDMNNLTNILKESLEQQNKLDNMRKEWTAGVVHDLKTPLSYINGYSAMLSSTDYKWNEQEVQRFGEIIHDKANHLLSLINDLNIALYLEADEIPVEKSDVNINIFLEELVTEISQLPEVNHHELIFEDLVNKSVILDIDHNLLKRALTNLMVNSIKHNQLPCIIKCSMEIFEEYLLIKITDNGIGMDEQVVEKLFINYYRGTATHESTEGTGLGMGIAFKLIQAQGGELSVNSKVNEGTCFTVKFPL